MTELRPDELSDWIAGSTLVVYGDKRPVPVNLDAMIASERRKLHWRDRFALWLAKHVRRWERACG